MYETNNFCSTKWTLWKMKVFLIAHRQFMCDRFNSSLNWTNRLKTIWMTVFSTQIQFLIVFIVAKLNIPVTKESVPTGRWWALHSALPGLLTAITEPELRVNRPREPWRSLALSSFLLSLSSVLLSTMRKADENPRFQQRFSSQVFFGLSVLRVSQFLQALLGLPFPVLG